jgi:hypothetical protein
MKNSDLRPYLIRLALVMAISLVFALVFNEITYLISKDPTDRAPKTISLVIPAGTAQRIASGNELRIFPDEITFVVGDLLEVLNEDSEPHQMGPVFVPPGATGSMVLDQAKKMSVTCSFQSSRYLGLDIRPATTLGTRIAGLFVTAPTLAALLFLYSLAAYPIKPAGHTAEPA